jgi:hypothetical protein
VFFLKNIKIDILAYGFVKKSIKILNWKKFFLKNFTTLRIIGFTWRLNYSVQLAKLIILYYIIFLLINQHTFQQGILWKNR